MVAPTTAPRLGNAGSVGHRPRLVSTIGKSLNDIKARHGMLFPISAPQLHKNELQYPLQAIVHIRELSIIRESVIEFQNK